MIDLKHYKLFQDNQIAALDFSQLNGDQFLSYRNLLILKMIELMKLNLDNFSTSQISERFPCYSYSIGKLSPSTVAKNIGKIDPRSYCYLSDKQLNAIDYLSLTSTQREAFYDWNLKKMKNYPKTDPYKTYTGNPAYYSRVDMNYGGYDYVGGYSFGGGGNFWDDPTDWYEDLLNQYWNAWFAGNSSGLEPEAIQGIVSGTLVSVLPMMHGGINFPNLMVILMEVRIQKTVEIPD